MTNEPEHLLPDYPAVWHELAAAGLADWVAELRKRIRQVYLEKPHGDWPRWQGALAVLQGLAANGFRVEDDRVVFAGDFPPASDLRDELMKLHPWRKGPMWFGDLHVDTEWRSDWKWQRLSGKLSSLRGRRVLDVGCGNGYHLWHMLAEGARLALGVDPVQLYGCQFLAARHFAGDVPAAVLPLGIEHLPPGLAAFDTVFSMGVLYHRKSPIEHLEQLHGLLTKKGELVLETLIVEERELLLPPGRYAQMRNVWFLPDLALLQRMVERAGFRDFTVLDVTRTTTEEQRSTDWMTFQSLPDFLAPDDASKTIEGHPGPMRAVVKATKG
ncbi:MAG: tRNA 5-methoxyuridine(34)/uridine 5-oxyacetic acid(34) synthase CmoB [Verrucomicrobiota bacterium JB023]|nr:tRNA 5-methoxyuridine(34)/uridine 5-oxyacetic acid(34) synthase CmoB [Verrucomicrobiota bacterium JB023]